MRRVVACVRDSVLKTWLLSVLIVLGIAAPRSVPVVAAASSEALCPGPYGWR